MAFIPVYILILGFTIVIDYFAGILLENTEGSRRKLFLICSLCANIGVLAIFKYYNFLNNNFSILLRGFALDNPLPFLKIILPIGLSFHTFQAMSYTIEVYRGNQKAERHFGIYALYVMFYPQLVAGPIERPQNLLHQFREKYIFDYDRVLEGLKLMLWGLFKKIAIADRLAIYVNAVYNNPGQHNGKSFALATFFFAFQIYCDFSGYSDIAIGIAKVMGFKLMTNFNRPYFAVNISEFWKRWHISLSTWFRDYLYISLGGSRVSIPRWYFNLLLVFLISGLWHGANWTFIIWGALNGFYLIFAIISQGVRDKFNKITGIVKLPKLNHLLQILITFMLSCFAWIFFRANNLPDALLIIKKIFSFSGSLFIGNKQQLLYCVSGIVFLIIAEFRCEYFRLGALPIKTNHWLTEQIAYACIIVLILLFGVFDGGQFIYFQF
jgi:D-alanyl-lipoteichoic acid acyltransferase DltB (MBOAT superfamily)